MGLKAREWDGDGRRSTVDAATVTEIVERLADTWGQAECELDHEDAYQLLVATILSAQSTDRRVNMVTPALFSDYPTAPALARANPAHIEELVRSTGFYRQKTKNLLAMAQIVVRDFDGEIPNTMEQLVTLNGVARKTANVVLGTVFGVAAGVVVDTHVKRLAGRLGLTMHTMPEKVERDLMDRIPRDHWVAFAHQLIWHGRRVCHAKRPDCDHCSLAPLCPEAQVA